ncbi:MAG: hypothetical protein CME10_05990 [Gemmatimonadetes bacterium]|nr:hypothetical protein [Gemmatimonadota bacterium]|tara:strand:- start:201 stop:1601 length:1401 start_codon:yes stop_codon:yes gene_type:complete
MSSEDTNLTCPSCGAEFDVADSLRTHIEHELRAEIQKTTREEYDSQIKSIRQEEEEKQEEQKVKIASQREELKALRKSQLELDELKETRDVELEEARAAGEKSVKDQLNAAKAEASKAHTQLEEIKEDYEEKIAKARADEQKSAKGELKQALASAKEAESKLEELKEDQEIALKKAEREAARQAKRKMDLELDELVNERLKEARGDDEIKLEKLRLELERRDKKIQELEEQRTASHGELEGEALEQATEQTLRNLHPLDLIAEVKRGRFGADIEHTVRNNSGATAGKILWECKKHKQWQDGWISTIRKNSIEYGADTMVIVTTTMPDGLETFGEVDGVFVCRYHETAVVSTLLRHAILRVSGERTRELHMQTIQERVLEYVSGPEFSMVMQGVMEAYELFEEDLRKEEQYMKTRWRKRRGYLRNVIESVTSMLGRLEQLGAGDFDVVESLDFSQPKAFIENGQVDY